MSGPLLDALLRASLQGALFVGAVWVVCRLLPNLPASVRCALWWLACLKIVAGLASPVELPWLDPVPPLPVPLPRAGGEGATAPTLHLGSPPSPKEGGGDVGEGGWGGEGLLALWLAGSLAQLAATGRQLGHARGLVRRALPVEDSWIVERFEELRRDLGLGERLALRLSDEVEAPQVLGLLRPVVLLPSSRPLSRTDLSMALCHELVHVRRADLWWGWGPALAQRLFWFHPLVKLAAREYALAREAACDAEVLRVLDPEPRAYGRLLLRLGIAPSATTLAAAGAAPSVQTLKRRLQMLEQSSENRRLPLGWVGLIVLVAALAVIPFRMVAQEAPPEPPAPGAPAPPAEPGAPAPPAEPGTPAPPARAPQAVPPAPPTPGIPAVAPVPPTPPTPPTPPRPMSLPKGESYVLLSGDSRTVMNGSMSDVRKAKDLQQGDEPLLYFRRNGKEYVVRDAATVKAAQELFRAQSELGALGKEAETKFRGLVDEALRTGKAQEVG